MICDWTGSPPGEFTTTASATACDVLILFNLFTTFYVLHKFIYYVLAVIGPQTFMTGIVDPKYVFTSLLNMIKDIIIKI